MSCSFEVSRFCYCLDALRSELCSSLAPVHTQGRSRWCHTVSLSPCGPRVGRSADSRNCATHVWTTAFCGCTQCELAWMHRDLEVWVSWDLLEPHRSWLRGSTTHSRPLRTAAFAQPHKMPASPPSAQQHDAATPPSLCRLHGESGLVSHPINTRHASSIPACLACPRRRRRRCSPPLPVFSLLNVLVFRQSLPRF